MVLKYYSFGNGIGPVAKAMSLLGINAVCVGIAEVDVESILVNYNVNGGLCSVSIPDSREELVNALTPFRLRADLGDMDHEKLRMLYTAHFSTKNMGDIDQVHSMPTACDLVVYCFNDLTHLTSVKKIIYSTPNKPKVLLFETIPRNASHIDNWLVALSEMGYYSVAHTIRAEQCGVPVRRGRHFVMSNLKQFSMDFRHLANATITPLIHFLRDEGVDRYTYSSGKYHGIDGILPPGKVAIACGEGLARYITPLEHWLLSGYSDDDYANARSDLTDQKLIRVVSVASPVYLFVEIFKNLFVSPISTISTTISVPSAKLEVGRMRENIIQLLKTQYEGKCLDRSHGFISNVVELKSVRDAYVSNADSTNKFVVTYTIRSVKPRLNNVYSGTIKACYITGIFTSIQSFEEYGFVCNVLVMADTFDKRTKTISLPCCNSVFSKGQSIVFQIVQIVYDSINHGFMCIGTHKC